MSAFFQIRKKVHWSDTDAAGVVWFPNFLRWFEDAEEEMVASLGRSRQSLLDSHQFSMPRVEVQSKFRSPARAGQVVRVGINTTVENPRRLHHAFEIRDDESNALLAEGAVRLIDGQSPVALALPEVVSNPGVDTTGGHLDKLPRDPWGQPYQYLNPGLKSEVDVLSFGADGQSGGEGRNADIGSWQ